MLVLSRQRDETIMIGDEIELTIVDIRGDKVRIGIKAPSHIAVHRKEVYEAIKKENEDASRISDSELTSLAPSLDKERNRKNTIPAAGRVQTSRSSQRKESA